MKIRPLYLLNVILTIVLLTSLLANAAINRSGTAATKEYDPWKDMNEDGKINILDLVIEAGYFGTSGDPTKNVNVTNWPSTYYTNVMNWPTAYVYGRIGEANITWEGGHGSIIGPPWINTGGYSRMSVGFDFEDWSKVGTYNVTIILEDVIWENGGQEIIYGINKTLRQSPSQTEIQITSYPVIFETKAPLCRLEFSYLAYGDPGWVQFCVWVYLRNE